MYVVLCVIITNKKTTQNTHLLFFLMIKRWIFLLFEQIREKEKAAIIQKEKRKMIQEEKENKEEKHKIGN